MHWRKVARAARVLVAGALEVEAHARHAARVAIAEFALLVRDCLVYEDDEQIVLFAGIPPAWFTDWQGMSLVDVPTYNGTCTLSYSTTATGATLLLSGTARPLRGYELRLPASLLATCRVDGVKTPRQADGSLRIPSGATQVVLYWR